MNKRFFTFLITKLKITVMTNFEIQDMKSWPEEALKTFFTEILGMYKKGEITSYMEGKLLFHGKLLFKEGMIYLIKSQTGKRKLYAKYSKIFDNHKFSFGFYEKLFLDLEKNLLDYESKNYQNDPIAHRNMIKRERRIFLRNIFEFFGPKIKKAQPNQLDHLIEEFLTQINKRKDVSFYLDKVSRELIFMCLGNLKVLSLLIEKKKEGQYPHFFEGIEEFQKSLIEVAQKYNSSILPKLRSLV